MTHKYKYRYDIQIQVIHNHEWKVERIQTPTPTIEILQNISKQSVLFHPLIFDISIIVWWKFGMKCVPHWQIQIKFPLEKNDTTDVPGFWWGKSVWRWCRWRGRLDGRPIVIFFMLYGYISKQYWHMSVEGSYQWIVIFWSLNWYRYHVSSFVIQIPCKDTYCRLLML